jgi:hypothetical protein
MEGFFDSLRQSGWVPHKGQAAYLKCPARYRVLACGRRWGKTDAAAADIALRIVSRDSSRQLAIAPTLAQASIVFERVRYMLTVAGVLFLATMTPHPSIRIAASDEKSAPVVHIMDARSGHDAKNLRGIGADHILIDEAAYVPESLVLEVAMPMLAANNGRMTLISTPRGRGYFHRFFTMGQRHENGFWSRHGPSWENPLVGQDYVDLQRNILSERAFRTEYGAEFLDPTSTVFSSSSLDSALMAPQSHSGLSVIGIDWARYSDYTAVVELRGSKVRAEVIACAQWNGLRWSDQVERAAQFIRSRLPAIVISDVTGVGDPVTEQLAGLVGCPVEGFHFTRQSKATIIERLVWAVERGGLRLPADPELLRQMENFEAESDEGGVRYAAASGFHDDLVCALAMAFHALPNSQNLRVLSRRR